MNTLILNLYIIGDSPISKRAINNLEVICMRLENSLICKTQIFDLLEHDGLAEKEKILATPLLLKSQPLPQRRIIGDLSNHEKIIEILGVD